MSITIRPMLPEERKYTYSQSQQLTGQTGSIGRLRGDFDSGGKGFFTTWFDHRADRKTEAFKTEFDEVINALRFDSQYGGFLKDRNVMTAYCQHHTDSAFDGSYCKEYGFRVDTNDHAYLLRCNPTKGDYNFYCFCYQTQWLDHHIDKAKQGIRFIDPHYNDKFRLTDGDQIRMIYADGETRDAVCRYIDETHLEVGNNLYHICELAERLEANDTRIVPLRSSLPETCLSLLPSTKELIVLRRGETGYSLSELETFDPAQNHALATEYNQKHGISKAQAEAMLTGSLFGFDVPGADPKNYDENGVPNRPKQKDRGDAR